MPPEPFDPFRYAHEHYSEIAWMSQNTNHLFPPKAIEEALRQAIREHRYQGYPLAPGDPNLKDLVRDDLGLSGVRVGLTAGGTEALYMITRALLSPGDEVVASDPSYLIIHKFIELSGARTVNLDIYEAPWRLTSDRVQAAITPRTKMILLIDPLNPLGSGYPPEEVRAIAEIARDHDLFLLNDVTYRDFSERHTLAHPFAPERTITVWSVSKNCGLAGLRLGGFAAGEPLFSRIWKYNTNDLGVSVLAQVAATAALREKPRVFPEIRRLTRSNQERIFRTVARIPGVGLPVYPSQANMFVIDISATGISPEDLQRELLLRHGVFLRAGNYLSPRFGARFIRASFSNPPSDIERFEKGFPEVLESLRASVPTPR
jgi:aspartate aminotransferase